MKNTIATIVFSFIFLFLLSGCKKPSLTYSYLMQHPAVLQKEMMNCQLSLINDSQCDLVKRAANDFSVLVSERQSNPEQFGEKILRAQQLQAIKLQELKTAQKNLSDKRAEEQAEQAYQIQLANVQTLIAVVKMTSAME